MQGTALFIFLFLLVVFCFFPACNLFLNYQPDITILYNGKPIQYSLDLSDERSIEVSINASDPDGYVRSVFLNTNSGTIDITGLDTNQDSNVFETNYTLPAPGSGNISAVSIIVNDDRTGSFVKEIQLDSSESVIGDDDNPVEIVIPEIQGTDNGILNIPAPVGEVYYYNKINAKEESDIQLDEPVHGEIYARRYIKVAGTAIPDDSGYTDRGYHSVLFSVDNKEQKNYFTIPVGKDNKFRGYLYFPAAGTYTVHAYRFWNSYLYPHNRGTDYTVFEGTATLKFVVVINPGNEVPAEYVHLIPTRNVDSGTRYLREYARKLTDGITNPMEQVKAIFRFLALGDEKGAFQYQYYFDIYPGYLDDCWSDIFIASHFLTNRVGVCNDFSELFAALTRSLGFKVQKIWGYVPNSSGHQWNRIQINGIWYRLDSTWACGSSHWQNYAEFYDSFDAASFTSSHENTYYSNYTVEY